MIAPWHERAACGALAKDGDAIYFIESRSGRAHAKALREAQKLCGPCPVWKECLVWAITNEEQHGIWGGMSPSQRAVLSTTLMSEESVA